MAIPPPRRDAGGGGPRPMRWALFDAADEQRLELPVLDLVDDHRHADLALLAEVRDADIGQLGFVLEERVLHLERRDRLLESLDIVDRPLPRLLQRGQDDLER